MRNIARLACIFVLGCISAAAQPLDQIRKTAEAGDAKAMTELGKLALRQRDPQLIEALKWFRKAAELGDANAMAQLGRMYALGWAGPKSDEKAIELFRRSAEAGDGDGMAFLGQMYREGHGGLAKDDKEAVKWFQKSAELGSGAGMVRLSSAYSSGAGIAKDSDSAIFWYRSMRQAGDRLIPRVWQRLAAPIASARPYRRTSHKRLLTYSKRRIWATWTR